MDFFYGQYREYYWYIRFVSNTNHGVLAPLTRYVRFINPQKLYFIVSYLTYLGTGVISYI